MSQLLQDFINGEQQLQEYLSIPNKEANQVI